MSDLLEYKCPCCGAAIAIDSASQKMKCPYCDTEFDVETLIAYDAELKKDEGKTIRPPISAATTKIAAAAIGRRASATIWCRTSAIPAEARSWGMKTSRLRHAPTAAIP